MSKLIRRPTGGGWWTWFEDGTDCGEGDCVLIQPGGRFVAHDDEWCNATEIDLDAMERIENGSGCSLNYWAGTATTQKMMPGMWRRATEKEIDSIQEWKTRPEYKGEE